MTNTHAAPVPADSDNPDGVLEDEFKPLTKEEARQWRLRNPALSPWWVIGLQVATGLVVAAAACVFGSAAGMSAAYGACAVILPAMVLARGLRRQTRLQASGAAFLSFVVWEVVKVVLTVALLLAAPRLVPALNWLALVAGFVVTMKVYWVAAWLQSKRRHPAVIL